MFVTRGSRSTAHLAWRVRLFSGAALLALVGLFTNQRLPIWGAIGLLLVAFLLRFAAGAEPTVDPSDPAAPYDPSGDATDASPPTE